MKNILRPFRPHLLFVVMALYGVALFAIVDHTDPLPDQNVVEKIDPVNKAYEQTQLIEQLNQAIDQQESQIDVQITNILKLMDSVNVYIDTMELKDGY